MPLVIENVATAGRASGNRSFALNCAGLNRGIGVIVTGDYTGGSVTYNSVPLSLKFAVTSQACRTLGFYLINPTVGSNTVYVTAAGGGNMVCAWAFSGSEQFTGVRDFGVYNDEGDWDTNYITAVADSVLGDLMVFGGTWTTSGFPTAWADQNTRLTQTGGPGGYMGDKVCGGGTTTMGAWIVYEWKASGGFTVMPSPAGGSQTIWCMSKMYDKLKENRKKLGIGDLGNFGLNGGIWKPEKRLATI